MSKYRLPAPLTSGHLCPDCGGTGADANKTAAAHKSGALTGSGSYIRCWSCNGNGLEPYYPNSDPRPYVWISFADGRARRLRSITHQGSANEAIAACESTDTAANLLDDRLNIVAKIKRDTTLNAWIVEAAQV